MVVKIADRSRPSKGMTGYGKDFFPSGIERKYSRVCTQILQGGQIFFVSGVIEQRAQEKISPDRNVLQQVERTYFISFIRWIWYAVGKKKNIHGFTVYI